MDYTSELLQLKTELSRNGFGAISSKIVTSAELPMGGLDGARTELLRAYNTLYSLTDDLGSLYGSTGYRDLLQKDPAEAARLDRIKREWNSSLAFLHKAIQHIEVLRRQSR
jgi:hypothetical protein